MLDKRDLKLMAKLGIVTRDTDGGDAFLLWGKLLDDEVVLAKSRGERPFPKYPCFIGSPHSAIAKFTPEEKIALRDRLLGVVEIPR